MTDIKVEEKAMAKMKEFINQGYTMIDEAVKVDFKKEVDQLREIFGYDNTGD